MLRQTHVKSPVNRCRFSLESAGTGGGFAVGWDSTRCKNGRNECEASLFTTHTLTNDAISNQTVPLNAERIRLVLFGQGFSTALLSG